VERMSRIIRQLLQFARPPTPRPTRVDLRALAEHTAELLAPIARKHRAEVSVAPVPEQVFADADRDQLQQVLMNLMVNGIQSMPEGGALSVRVEAVRARPPAPDEGEGDYVCVKVIDRGTGISPEDLPHIFDPFFTTKDVAAGTGLGLSISYGIVREHGGWIEVKSEPGEGSCFSVYLPEGSWPDAS